MQQGKTFFSLHFYREKRQHQSLRRMRPRSSEKAPWLQLMLVCVILEGSYKYLVVFICSGLWSHACIRLTPDPTHPSSLHFILIVGSQTTDCNFKAVRPVNTLQRNMHLYLFIFKSLLVTCLSTSVKCFLQFQLSDQIVIFRVPRVCSELGKTAFSHRSYVMVLFGNNANYLHDSV